MQGGDGMIPASLRDKWELLQARAELIFLADNGGGYPDALRGDGLTPAARRVLLRRLGFRVKEEYEMEAAYLWEPGMWPWVRLTNGVAVCLQDGFVSRAEKGGGQRG